MALEFVVRNFDYLSHRLHYHQIFPQVCNLQYIIFQDYISFYLRTRIYLFAQLSQDLSFAYGFEIQLLLPLDINYTSRL